MIARYGWKIMMASTLLMSALPGAVAPAAMVVKAMHGNSSRATAQGFFLRPDLVVKQKRPNDSLATAQPVGPTALSMPTDVVGSLTKGQPHAFFSFVWNGGHLEVSAKKPTTQFPALVLYNDGGIVVATASGNGVDGSSAVIDGGASGLSYVEVTGSPTHPDPKAQHFKYDLRVAPTPQYITVFGNVNVDPSTQALVSGFYSFATNDGDHLSLKAADDPPGPAELLLYDNQGNLVAVASGNASDGLSSLIDFTVPSGWAGSWVAEVTQAPGAVDPFDYSLTIKGATGTGPMITN
jgi:hypothetical protein